MRLLQRFSVAAAIITMLIPAAASAHFGTDSNTNANANVNAQISAHNDTNSDHENTRGLFLGHFMAQFTKGTVTSVGTSSFIIKTKDDTSVTVNSSSAKLIRLPRTTIAMADVKVGDRVWVQGARSGDTITATKVYDLSADVRPAEKKGQVTAVNGNTITLQTKNGNTATVTTDTNTQVKQDGQAASLSDVKVGSKVKIFGIWNKITSVFTAVLIKLK